MDMAGAKGRENLILQLIKRDFFPSALFFVVSVYYFCLFYCTSREFRQEMMIEYIFMLLLAATVVSVKILMKSLLRA